MNENIDEEAGREEDAIATMRNPDPADSRPPRPASTPTPAHADRPLAPDELAALARLDSDQPLTDADVVALNRVDEGPDGPGPDPDDVDPDCAPPEWWEAMSGEEKAWFDDPGPEPTQPDVLDAGFTHRGGTGGIGFAPGGLQDRMDACEALAICAGRVWDAGLGTLSDYELTGLVRAARRLTARQAALELAAIGELSARRAEPDGAPGEHLEDEGRGAADADRPRRGQAGRPGRRAEPAARRCRRAGRRADRHRQGRHVRRRADRRR